MWADYGCAVIRGQPETKTAEPTIDPAVSKFLELSLNHHDR